MVCSIWYPIGGYHKVVESLERIATEKYGAEIHYNSPVSSISQSADGKTATGVTLEKTGEFIEADLVVCNADLLWAYENLLPSTKYSRSLLKNPKLTCSSISFYWGLKSKVEKLETHNIFLAEKYKESFDKIFDEYSLPEEPSFCKFLLLSVDVVRNESALKLIFVAIMQTLTYHRELILVLLLQAKRRSSYLCPSVICWNRSQSLR